MSRGGPGHFEQIMIPNKKKEKSNRIPVRFVEEDEPPASVESTTGDVYDGAVASDDGLRANTHEGEVELQPDVEDGGEKDNGSGGSEDVEPDEVETPALAASAEQAEESDDPNKADPTSPSDDNSADSPGGDPAAGPMLAELIATRAELRRVETERNDLLERLARRQADFENYRKRIERERSETYQRMVAEVVRGLLPVMDNMRRALEAESVLEKNESAEFRHFLRGVELIYKQLNDALVDLGVEAVPAVGQPFDPNLHEAVATEHSEEYEPDIVTQELLRGYRLGEKLLRPAMVKVSTRR